jgi:hypothetical protein
VSLFDEILNMFAAKKVDLKDVPDHDPIAALGRRCESLFTGGVEALRSVVPNERIRALARIVWDLVGNKRVLVVLGADVPSLSFTVMREKIVDQGLVLIPKAWPQMVEDDPFMQIGAILFVGAQVVDFYNARLVDDPAARVRWEAYEAELLRTLKTWLPHWAPNGYQREVMTRYPDGLDTAGVDLYTLLPYESSKGDA